MIDPFSSELAIYHPKRIFFKLYVIVMEWFSKKIFHKICIAEKVIDAIPKYELDSRSGLSVTDEQMNYLLFALSETESLIGTVVIEVGAFRGETTSVLAEHTKRTVVAVDKYFSGWDLSASALSSFMDKTKIFDNVELERKTSGEAVSSWSRPMAGLIFIDAQHNFVNTHFDIETWLPKLVDGGLMAMHDVDQIEFAGTRLAAWLAIRKLTLWAHVDGLVICKKLEQP